MEIKVVVLNSTQLELLEDAKKGDIIDLSRLSKIDSSFILSLIEKNKNEELDKKVLEARKEFEKEKLASESALKADYEKKLSQQTLEMEKKNQEKEKDSLSRIQKLEADLTLSKKDNETKEALLKKDYETRISALESSLSQEKDSHDKEMEQLKKDNEARLENLNLSHKKDIELVKAETEKESSLKIQELSSSLDQEKKNTQNLVEMALLKAEKEHASKVALLEQEKESLQAKAQLDLMKKDKEKQEEIEKAQKDLFQLQQQYDNLNRSKASLNVKRIGENLESWCNDAFHSAQTLGAFRNCTWEKDNTLAKEDGETGSGSKADFIFRAYSGSGENPFQVTSCCMDMKSENPDSVNKKKNADYYKKLDSDRNKKKCEYALLVSELELKTNQDVPVFKVQEYPNMYVVRPQYLLTFLGILMNLSNKYSYLLEQKAREDERFKSSEEILADFEKLKETYLNKPIETLNRKITQIKKDADDIIKKGTSISESAEDIIQSTLESMKDKISTMDIKLPKLAKKIDNL